MELERMLDDVPRFIGAKTKETSVRCWKGRIKNLIGGREGDRPRETPLEPYSRRTQYREGEASVCGAYETRRRGNSARPPNVTTQGKSRMR